MGLLIFIIVLAFNFRWLNEYGTKEYINLYKWKESRWIAVALLIYTTTGVLNLLHWLIY